MSEILVNTIKKADGTGGLTVPSGSGTVATLAGGTFTGDITMSSADLVVGSNSIFIGGTGSANEFSDYEEGTFTPAVKNGSGGTMTAGTSTGVYRKIGDLVYVSISLTNITKSGSGTLELQGLPFTVASSSASGDPTGVCRWDDVSTDTQMYAYFKADSTEITFQQFSTSGYNGNVTINDASSQFEIYNVTGSYITSA